MLRQTVRMSARRKARIVHEPPTGFRLLPDFITPGEEECLISAIERLPFERVVMRGHEARRQVVHFGVRYAYDHGPLAPAPALPDFLTDLSTRAAQEARFPRDARIEALVTRYPPGAPIGWHRDAPPFGPSLAGLSLASPCELRLRLETPSSYDVCKLRLEPRSLYVISGVARFHWQHAIPPVPRLRYSVTFRTIRGDAKAEIVDPRTSAS
ncbi:MAG: alpha-ketoglutarate-dependent dioxygenase AlkB [Sulfurifustaceae bacterium]